MVSEFSLIKLVHMELPRTCAEAHQSLEAQDVTRHIRANTARHLFLEITALTVSSKLTIITGTPATARLRALYSIENLDQLKHC